MKIASSSREIRVIEGSSYRESTAVQNHFKKKKGNKGKVH